MPKRLVGIAKRLRRELTETERILWKHLRANRLDGLKFRRQQPLGQYIVDFVCLEKMIIIELDGGQHAQSTARDTDNARDNWFKDQGFKVLRFWNNNVLFDIQSVLEVIRDKCSNHPPIKGGGVWGKTFEVLIN